MCVCELQDLLARLKEEMDRGSQELLISVTHLSPPHAQVTCVCVAVCV